MALLTDAMAENRARHLPTWEEMVREKWERRFPTPNPRGEEGRLLCTRQGPQPLNLFPEEQRLSIWGRKTLRGEGRGCLSLLTLEIKAVAKHGSMA